METVPEVSVISRKPLTVTQAAKRLRRFLRANSRPEAEVLDEEGEDSNELVCTVPEETLFQLQQIHDSLSGKALIDISGSRGSSDTPRTPSAKKRARHEKQEVMPANDSNTEEADGGERAMGEQGTSGLAPEKSSAKKKKDKTKINKADKSAKKKLLTKDKDRDKSRKYRRKSA